MEMMYKTAKENDTRKSLQQLMDENSAYKEAYCNDSKHMYRFILPH